MIGFNNDKLWLAFEASGCVGDYLNYKISKIMTDEFKLFSNVTNNVSNNVSNKDNVINFKENRNYIQDNL